jgi:ABC-type glycerol-3-phosphate transport system substrate-binding protein
MRKIILAAAIATSALGLTACGGNAETETDETVQAMGEQAEEAGEDIANTTEAAVEDVEAAADEAADTAVKTVDEIGNDALDVVNDAEEAGAE